MDKVFVVRQVDYDGGRRCYVCKEKLHKKLAKAELTFSEWSKPENYGSTTEPYVPIDSIKFVHEIEKPQGLIKMYFCRRNMMVVELCELTLE